LSSPATHLGEPSLFVEQVVGVRTDTAFVHAVCERSHACEKRVFIVASAAVFTRARNVCLVYYGSNPTWPDVSLKWRVAQHALTYRGTSLTRKCTPLGLYSRPRPRALR